MTFVSKKKRLLAQLRFSLKALNRAERKCRPLLIGCSVHISAKDFFYEPLINCSKRHIECPICLKKKRFIIREFQMLDLENVLFFPRASLSYSALTLNCNQTFTFTLMHFICQKQGLVPSEEIGMGRLKSCLRGCQGYKCLQW